MPGGLPPSFGAPAPTQKWERDADWPKAFLDESGRWALGTFGTSGRESKYLRAHAAAAVAAGIPEDAVLAAMTRNAAELLGVADRIGSLAVGKDADLAVFAGDPLDPSTPVWMTVVGGGIVHRQAGPPTPSLPLTKDSGLPSTLPEAYVLQSKNVLLPDGRARPARVRIVQGKIDSIDPPTSPDPTFDLGDALLAPGLVAGINDFDVPTEGTETADADGSEQTGVDGFNPRHENLRKLFRGGFLYAVHSPSPSQTIGAPPARLTLGPDGATSVTPTGMRFTLTGAARNPERAPASLSGQAEALDDYLSKGPKPAPDLGLPEFVRSKLDAARKTRWEGAKTFAFFDAQTPGEVAQLASLAAKHGLKGSVAGPIDPGKIAAELKATGLALVLQALKPDDYDRPLDEAAAAARAGIPLGFAGANSEQIRMLASAASARGLPRGRALRGLTTEGAKAGGFPEGAAEIRAGGPADLVIWSGSPLDLRAKPLAILLGGKRARLDGDR